MMAKVTMYKLKYIDYCQILFFLFFIILTSHTYGDTDKFRLIIRDDPATTICIGWNQVSGEAPLVYYGSKDLGTDYAQYPHKHSPDRAIEFKGMKNRYARLTYLKPDTKYYFIVKDSEGISPRFWFKTAPSDSDSPLSIVAGGDSRNNSSVRRNANKMVSKLRPDVVLFGGDMTRQGKDEQWQKWFDDWQFTISEDGRMYPIIATRGNHERSNEIIFNLFDVPHDEIYYALGFAKDLLRVYTLNTEISIKGDQTKWLAKDLEQNRHFRWKIVQYHKPMRPHVLRKYEGQTTYE